MALGISYSALVEGQSLGRIEVEVTDADVRSLVFANTGHEPATGPAAVPPSMILVLGLRSVMGLNLIPPGGVLVGHTLDLRRPFAVGEKLDVDVMPARVWTSRGRPFVTLRVDFRAGGANVATDDFTAIWPTDGSNALQSLPALAPAAGAQRISQPQVERYAEVSGDRNPLHLDKKFSAVGPFGELVVHGVIPAGLLLDRWTAEHPPRPGVPVRLGFLSPLRPDEDFELRLDASDAGSAVVRVPSGRDIATLTADVTS